MSQKTPVIVGISGGVDSAVAALLLIEQGYAVEGLFMKNWEEDDDEEYCAAAEDLADAQSVCDQLGIRLRTVNFATEYWDRVFEYFLEEYRSGRTPNPDIMCNKEIKFKAFLDYARSLGAEFIATGHYARITQDRGLYQLRAGLDDTKDQSYFLYTLGQPQLAKSLFPLGEMEKTAVRELARKHNFTNSDKKDSTGICFIGERKFSEFLNRFLPAQPGEIITPEGKVIGQHNGLMYYTMGQRQGLGIGGRKDSNTEPWFAAEKNLQTNQLIAVQGHDHPLLMHRSLDASQLTWVSGSAPELPRHATAKIRYRQQSQSCVLESIEDGSLRVVFEQPQRAITSGQSIVIYEDDNCLGGGIIDHRYE
ncbi:MAG TPA: tRNA 2-thiouridine(34) synthase MnmA [Gammaproteobacteria bacterium]|nr:tRNA 2-thiouridine(34) synthase MnmA [Gammaproteobacteria bacterium]